MVDEGETGSANLRSLGVSLRQRGSGMHTEPILGALARRAHPQRAFHGRPVSVSRSRSRTAGPADPAVFATIIPTWHIGDEFLAGDELRKLRIVAIPRDVATGCRAFDAVWIVEPVECQR